jgi:squalene-associated FAD-dependent desaturase
MKKIIVIGGGFAGLSAAAFLADSGNKVELIEASPKLGGRAYSFYDDETGSVIDNGQHILMGCYKETLKFLKLIGAEKNFSYQENLKVDFLNNEGKHFKLQATQFFYPLNHLFGLINFEALSLIDRLNVLKFFIKLYFYSDSELKKLTVHQWFLLEGQNKKIREAFWDFLAVGALNTSTTKASAKAFADILKEMFSKGNKASTIILPLKGLTESYCKEAQSFIEGRGGTISLSEQVTGFEIENDKVKKILTSKRTIKDFDYVICAVPWFAVKTFEVNAVDKLSNPRMFLHDFNLNFEHSAILTIHIWLKNSHAELGSVSSSIAESPIPQKVRRNNLTEDFYALIGSPINWIFNHRDHITLVKSDANDIIDKTKEELFEMAVTELIKYAGIGEGDIKSYKVIKEKRATFVPDNETIDKRPDIKTEIKNLFLAGDWVNTGLPSTIESAVKSGRVAFEEILYS